MDDVNVRKATFLNCHHEEISAQSVMFLMTQKHAVFDLCSFSWASFNLILKVHLGDTVCVYTYLSEMKRIIFCFKVCLIPSAWWDIYICMESWNFLQPVTLHLQMTTEGLHKQHKEETHARTVLQARILADTTDFQKLQMEAKKKKDKVGKKCKEIENVVSGILKEVESQRAVKADRLKVNQTLSQGWFPGSWNLRHMIAIAYHHLPQLSMRNWILCRLR